MKLQRYPMWSIREKKNKVFIILPKMPETLVIYVVLKKIISSQLPQKLGLSS